MNSLGAHFLTFAESIGYSGIEINDLQSELEGGASLRQLASFFIEGIRWNPGKRERLVRPFLENLFPGEEIVEEGSYYHVGQNAKRFQEIAGKIDEQVVEEFLRYYESGFPAFNQENVSLYRSVIVESRDLPLVRIFFKQFGDTITPLVLENPHLRLPLFAELLSVAKEENDIERCFTLWEEFAAKIPQLEMEREEMLWILNHPDCVSIPDGVLELCLFAAENLDDLVAMIGPVSVKALAKRALDFTNELPESHPLFLPFIDAKEEQKQLRSAPLEELAENREPLLYFERLEKKFSRPEKEIIEMVLLLKKKRQKLTSKNALSLCIKAAKNYEELVWISEISRVNEQFGKRVLEFYPRFFFEVSSTHPFFEYCETSIKNEIREALDLRIPWARLETLLSLAYKRNDPSLFFSLFTKYFSPNVEIDPKIIQEMIGNCPDRIEDPRVIEYCFLMANTFSDIILPPRRPALNITVELAVENRDTESYFALLRNLPPENWNRVHLFDMLALLTWERGFLPSDLITTCLKQTRTVDELALMSKLLEDGSLRSYLIGKRALKLRLFWDKVFQQESLYSLRKQLKDADLIEEGKLSPELFPPYSLETSFDYQVAEIYDILKKQQKAFRQLWEAILSNRHMPREKAIQLRSQVRSLEDIRVALCDDRFVHSLTAFEFGYERVPELPREIGLFSKLREIDIFDSHLERVSSAITKLTQLEKIKFTGGTLRSLPSLAGLTKLTSLILERNQLTELPKLPPQLKSLFVGENRLTKWPREIVALPNLKALSLCKNQLGALPLDFEFPQRIKLLDLSDLSLDQIPFQLQKLQRLQSLYLNHSPLAAFPEDISCWPSLQFVSLEKTPISEEQVDSLRSKGITVILSSKVLL